MERESAARERKVAPVRLTAASRFFALPSLVKYVRGYAITGVRETIISNRLGTPTHALDLAVRVVTWTFEPD